MKNHLFAIIALLLSALSAYSQTAPHELVVVETDTVYSFPSTIPDDSSAIPVTSSAIPFDSVPMLADAPVLKLDAPLTNAASEIWVPDTISTQPSYYADRNWLYLLKRRQLKPNTPHVEWPRFLGFCMDVYNWADRVFNSYDPDYVKPTGKKWKLRFVSDNWVDLYYFHAGEQPAMRLSGNINPNIGLYVHWLAVSIGYSVDIRSLVTGEKARHEKVDFNFACSRLAAEFHYWKNDGSAFIRKIDGYENGKWIKEAFNGLEFRSIYASILYIFNNKKFSYGAAYNLSNYQVKSAGSFFAGIVGSFYDAEFDFSKIPADIATVMPIHKDFYRMHYNSALMMGGYSYNWVCNKHLLFNFSLFPAIGVTTSYADSYDGKRTELALLAKQQMSLTYNNRNFFATLTSNLTANLYQTNQIGFFSAIENFQFATGIRF